MVNLSNIANLVKIVRILHLHRGKSQYNDCFATGLQLAADKFFIYFLTIMLGNIAAVSISFSISAAVNVASVANLFISIVYVVSLVRVLVFQQF